MLRRHCIMGLLASCLSCALMPWRVWAGRKQAAFSAIRLDEALAEYLSGREARHSGQITMRVEPLVENGAVVPIKINTELSGVRRIAIFVEKNPNPLVAGFELGEGCRGFIATRIKVGEPSNVIAVVDTDSGAYRRDTFIEVVEGGCA